MSVELNTCEAEYAKDPNIRKEDVQQLLEWIRKQPYLPKVTEYQLIQFYHASDYSTQKTKQLVDVHYQFKNEAKSFYSGLDFQPPRYSHSFWDLAYCFDLPEPCPDGYRILYCGLRDYDPSKYNFEIVTSMGIKLMLTIIMQKGICPGYTFLMDLKGFTLSHLSSVSISALRNYLYISQETLQLKVKKVHIVNGMGKIEKIMTLCKPFMKKELFEMIHIHSDKDKFFESFGKERLPKDFGGTLPFTRDEYNTKMRYAVDALSKVTQEELDLRSDEKKRVNACPRDGYSNGSFKKLDID